MSEQVVYMVTSGLWRVNTFCKNVGSNTKL